MERLTRLTIIAVLGLVDCGRQPPKPDSASAPTAVRPAMPGPVAPVNPLDATPGGRALFAKALGKALLRKGISAEVTTTIGDQDVLEIEYGIADRAWAFNFMEELVASAPFKAARFRGVLFSRHARDFWAYDAAGNETTVGALLDPILKGSSPKRPKT